MTAVRPVVILFVACLACSPIVAAQERPDQTVRLDILVSDGKRPLRGLTAADFEITDAGVPQRILSVATPRAPVNVILVLDSESDGGASWLKHSVAAARAVLAALERADRAALVAWTSGSQTTVPLTTDRQQVSRALDALRPGGPSVFGDAVVAALEISEGAPGRTLMIVAGTPDSTRALATSDALRLAVARQGVVVYAVGKTIAYDRTVLEPDQKPPRTAYPGGEPVPVGFDHGLSTGPALRVEMRQLFLESMAMTSGGRAMTAPRPAEFRKLFVEALTEFRERYVVAYEPAGVPPDGWHRVEVKLKTTRGSIRARPGYFAR